jgi:membrane protein
MKIDLSDFFKRLRDKISDDDILGNSAQVAFYFSFALFPLLLFLMSVLGVVLSDKEQMQAKLFQMLADIMPASAFELVKNTLDEVTSNASGSKITLGIATTLWAASAGVDNMRGTLNEVYNLKETRSWIKAKLTSLFLTLGIGFLILLAIGTVVYGSRLMPTDSILLAEIGQWVAILCLLLLAFALLYNFAPNHAAFKWKWITPGSVIGVLLWIALSMGFRLYLHYFNSYSKTYGSLGAMIILQLWLYLTALVILLGGAVNAILDEKSGIKKGTKDQKQVKEEKDDTGHASRT